MSTDVLAGYIDEGASYIYAGNDIGSVCVYTLSYIESIGLSSYFFFSECV